MTHPAISVPTLIAHRGYSAAAPENTLAAVRAAHQAGATWVELDVQLLKDDTPVIWHDGDVRRCSDGRGELANLTWQQAQQLDVGSWFGDRFAGEKMASLEAMLALLNELEMGVNLEIKVNKGRDPIRLVDVVLPAVLAALPPERLVISSFDPVALAHCRQHALIGRGSNRPRPPPCAATVTKFFATPPTTPARLIAAGPGALPAPLPMNLLPLNAT